MKHLTSLHSLLSASHSIEAESTHDIAKLSHATDESHFASSLAPSDSSLPMAAASPTSLNAATNSGRISDSRYRVIRSLGRGGFGEVVLAFDEQLRRHVAIKRPHVAGAVSADRLEAFLQEARVAARLDDPRIVPVYDVGYTDDGHLAIVSKYVEGQTLSKRLSDSPIQQREAVEIIETVAFALQHAHERGLIHRDVKPGNVLLESQTGKVFLADFGLALVTEEINGQESLSGTPAYMSPEQIRGESHRLDGRSDVFALGVMLYELLTGQRPFRGPQVSDVLQAVLTIEPPPPSLLNSSIPIELDRICMRALCKRATERQASAAELAADLRAWLNQADVLQSRAAADSELIPRGLRPFGREDASFFADLLPGPRDRFGLPESIAFWQRKIATLNLSFRIGLLLGPSGCGKSSLLRAGVIPHLPPDVVVIELESIAVGMEDRIRNELRRVIPYLPAEGDLTELLTLLRQERGRKICLVLDQFEQWLDSNPLTADAPLLQSLRQCDGSHVQALLAVRDDYAMAAARVMGVLEEPIREGENFATLDRFDDHHARLVLRRIGLAYGKLQNDAPNDREATTTDFIEQAILMLSIDGRVAPVHLIVFAELTKDHPWEPATLRRFRGMSGLGLELLEQTFGGRAANPVHRQDSELARQILSTLIPESASDLKGPSRTYEEIVSRVGNAIPAEVMERTIDLLDRHLRLITRFEMVDSASSSDSRRGGYQLAHDFLVPAIRDWLARHRRATRRGRAEMILSERAADWNEKPETRVLPTLLEWGSILTYTRSGQWSDLERRLMARASRHHGLRVAVMTVILSVSGASLAAIYGWARIERLERLAIEESRETQRRNLRSAIQEHLEEGRRYLANNEYASAAQECRRLEGLIAEASQLDDAPQQEAQELIRDVDAVFDFEIARVRRCGMPSCKFDYTRENPESILQNLGVDLATMTVADAADQIRRSAISEEIIAAIDDWVWVVAATPDDPRYQAIPELIALAEAADDDPRRQNLRRGLLDPKAIDEAALEALCQQAPSTIQPPTLILMANVLALRGKYNAAVKVLEKATLNYPDDFWLHLRLAELADLTVPLQKDVRLKHYEIARSLRPQNEVVANNLSVALCDIGNYEDAMVSLTEAIALDPDQLLYRHGRAIILTESGDTEAAKAEYRSIIESHPDFVPSHVNLASLLAQQGQETEARRLAERALSLQEAVVASAPFQLPERYNLSMIRTLCAKLDLNSGQYKKGWEQLETALEETRSSLSADRDGRIRANYEDLLFIMAEVSASRDDLKSQTRFLETASQIPGARRRTESLMLLARIELVQGNLVEALQLVEQAQSLPPLKGIDQHNALMTSAIVTLASADFPQEAPDSSESPESNTGENSIQARQLQALGFLRQAMDLGLAPTGDLAAGYQTSQPFASLSSTAEFHLLILDGYERALKQDPTLSEDPENAFRYQAACAALRASDCNPVDPETEWGLGRRLALRELAYQHLRRELQQRHTDVLNEKLAPRHLRRRLTAWQQDPHLALVRLPEHLQKLGPAESRVWEEFWNSVQAVISESQGPLPELPSSFDPT